MYDGNWNATNETYKEKQNNIHSYCANNFCFMDWDSWFTNNQSWLKICCVTLQSDDLSFMICEVGYVIQDSGFMIHDLWCMIYE